MRTGGQTGGIHVPLAEVQSAFTRFLLVKFRSVRMFKVKNQLNADGAPIIESGNPVIWPVDGKQAYLKDCKITVRASTYLRARLLPRTEGKINLRAGGENDVDAFGKMPFYRKDTDLLICHVLKLAHGVVETCIKLISVQICKLFKVLQLLQLKPYVHGG